MLFIVATGYNAHSYEGNFALAMKYVQSTYTTLTMTAVPLVYRYLVICRLVESSALSMNPMLLSDPPPVPLVILPLRVPRAPYMPETGRVYAQSFTWSLCAKIMIVG